MMNVAIPEWQSRVSPVFDVAATLLITELIDGREVGRRQVPLVARDPLQRAREVAELRPDVLICGAISWPLETALSSAGVRVVSQICGAVDEVLAAFREGNLADSAFVMPGCRCRLDRRRRRRRGHSRGAMPPGETE